MLPGCRNLWNWGSIRREVCRNRPVDTCSAIPNVPTIRFNHNSASQLLCPSTWTENHAVEERHTFASRVTSRNGPRLRGDLLRTLSYFLQPPKAVYNRVVIGSSTYLRGCHGSESMVVGLSEVSQEVSPPFSVVPFKLIHLSSHSLAGSDNNPTLHVTKMVPFLFLSLVDLAPGKHCKITGHRDTGGDTYNPNMLLLASLVFVCSFRTASTTPSVSICNDDFTPFDPRIPFFLGGTPEAQQVSALANVWRDVPGTASKPSQSP